jgi:zinc protease
MNAQSEMSNLKILEMYQPSSPIISFRVQLNIGSVNDPIGKEGLNALTSLMISAGGNKGLSYKQIMEKFYPWAASIDVTYDKEVTTFIGQVHKDHLEEFYKIFVDLLINPRFDPEDFKRNKEDLINYLENTLRGNDDENLGKEALNSFIYSNHPYKNPNAGTVQGLKSISLINLMEYHKKNYTQGNITFGIAGNYPKDLISRIKEDFSYVIKYASKEIILPETEPIEDIEVLLVEKECIATAISMGFPITINRSDKDFYALLIANSYFGEHRTFNGVLINHMRGDRGLNYGDYSYIENFIQDGGSTFPIPDITRHQQNFSIWIRPVEHDKRYFAIREALWELQNLVQKGLTEDDFQATQKFLFNYSRLWVQTQSRRLGYMLDSKFYGTDFFIDKIQDELSKIKVEDVNNAIKKYLNFQNIKVVIVSKGCEELKNNLIENKPSPITYKSTVSQQVLDEDKIIQNYKLNINKDKIKIIPAGELFEK